MALKTTRCLVTGGAGFIGSHLVERLVRDGFQTTVLDDLSAGSSSYVHEAATLVEGDVLDAGLVDDLVKEADYVFHLAAYTSAPASLGEPQICFEINTLGTLNVLQSARRHKVRKVIFASSSAVYGGNSPEPCLEEDHLEPLSPYAVTKLAGEHLLEVYWATYCLSYVAFRFFNVYGPRQNPEGGYAAVMPAFIQEALAGTDLTIYGDGEQTRDFVYVEDVGNAMRLAMDRGNGIYNLGCKVAVTINELAQNITEVASSGSKTRYESPRDGDILYSLADVTDAKRELGWAPEWSLAQGMQATVKWYQKTIAGRVD